MDKKTILAAMTRKEKLRLCTGADFWCTRAMPRRGVPALRMSDGPHGLRCQKGAADMMGINDSLPATCFPAAVTAGAAWDRALSAAIGRAIGLEAAAAGVKLVLGPGCNIKRSPLCGRNFEYFSEDPCLAGELAAAYIQGQQETGVGSCLKHFAANNQEYKRQNGDSRIDQRALREIYLAPFRRAVTRARPWAVMTAYNKLNGVHCSDHPQLLGEILRGEWGFEGLTVTDWGGLNDRVAAFRAGCDLSMPGGSRYMEGAALRALESGSLPEAAVDAAAGRILEAVLRPDPPAPEIDYAAHDALACRGAEEGAVLLKNEGALLPLPEEDVVLIGYMAKDFRCQGAGSSHINPTRLTSLTDAMPDAPWIPCGDAAGGVTEAELRRVSEAAGQARAAVVVAGLPDSYESEGIDRTDMAMPEGHVRMIRAAAAANPNTVVVLLGGSPMETPWWDEVRAVLYMGLPGQAGGRAAARLLTGRANPSGRLAESWPVSYAATPAAETFGQWDPEYRESIYVGYRYYEKAGVPVRCPFGHGLSYTQFAYSGLTIRGRTVTAAVTNTGSRPGAEVVQLYLAPPAGGPHRPVKELKGFQRLELAPGEQGEVRFQLEEEDFAVWQDGWRVPGGTYRVLLGASSADIRLEGDMDIAGEAVPAPDWQAGTWYEAPSGPPPRSDWEKAMGGPVPRREAAKRGSFTLDNTCLEMRDSSWLLRVQYRVTEWVVALRHGGRAPEDAAYRMMLACALDCPMRSIVINTAGRVGERLARCLVESANGRPLAAIAALLRRP